MAIRKIAQMGEPILRQVAQPVRVGDISSGRFQSLIDDMIETMRDADGAGLAAPQVYESIRVCVAEIEGNERYPEMPSLPLTVFVNPVVVVDVDSPAAPGPQDSIVMYEGCLSVDGIRGRVRRPRRVRVDALDRHGRPVSMQLEGFLAAVIQHEADHLDGVLFVDRAEPTTLAFLREFQRFVPVDERMHDGASDPR